MEWKWECHFQEQVSFSIPVCDLAAEDPKALGNGGATMEVTQTSHEGKPPSNQGHLPAWLVIVITITLFSI
jgi:hypothetical protein